ncbi:MAG: flavodoxin domain-containing protein [Anaerolineaceae bacterium]|nr:flavodoxin domain-containing protein [Anaerolineaceae bacterium]
MNDKVLVTYASRAGSTAGVAEAIGKTLTESGIQVDVLPMQEVEDLAPYRAVVAGSAIRGRKWLPEAMEFLHDHQGELRQKPFAAFMVCITLSMKNAEQYREGLKDWTKPVYDMVRPVCEGYFAGALDFSKIPFSLNTLAMRLVALAGAWKEGDHCDWNAIRTWTESLLPLLHL